MKAITSTEASRRFSELLDRVRYKHEAFLVVRRGEAIARIGPATTPERSVSLAELVQSLGRLRTGDAAFADDLDAIQREQPDAGGNPWRS